MVKRDSQTLILLTGRAGCGKTRSCIEEFEASLREAKSPLADDLLFILPTAEHRSRALDLVLRDKLSGFFQRRITTFDRALEEFLRLGAIEFASGASRRAILADLLRSLPLTYFEGVSEMPGFVEAIARWIVELKEHLLTPEDFSKKAVLCKEQFPEFTSKYDDLCRIYEAYDRRLESEGLVDRRDALRLLEKGAARGEMSRPHFRRVWIDGFSDFSKLQLEFIRFLGRHADRVTVTLTQDCGKGRESLFEVVSETERELLTLGFRLKQFPPGKNYRSQTEALAYLEEHLFEAKETIKSVVLSHVVAGSSFRRKPESSLDSPVKPGNDRIYEAPERLQSAGSFEIDPSIRIFEATGLVGEVEMIAREIKRLVRERGYHFSDIAVLFRATDPYISPIQSVFRKFEIPVEIHERFRFSLTPIARILESFFEILVNDWTRSGLFNFLKAVSTDLEVVSALELQALEKGIFKDRAYWLRTFPEAGILKTIARFEDSFKEIRFADVFSTWLKAAIDAFGLLRFPETDAKPARFERESARRIFSLLDELRARNRSGSREKERSPEALLNEFRVLVQADLFSVHSRDKNKVQVYNVSLARQKEYKAVFAAGLLEKEFPVQAKEDPLLSDAERRVLNAEGIVLKERLPRQALERYLFYLAVTRARERLVLSYPRFNLEGKEMLPSFYVEDVRKLFKETLPIKKRPVAEVLPPWEDLSSEEEAEAAVIYQLWRIDSGKRNARADKIACFLYNRFRERPEFKTLASRLLKKPKEKISDERIRLNFLPESGIWTPTRFEEYVECPYRFYAHRLLNLESQTEGIDLRRRGTILHEVLEQFFKRRKESKQGQAGFEEAKAFCLEIFNRLWDEEPLKGERYYRLELERKNMQEMIAGILRRELVENKPPIEGLEPAYFEYEFNDLHLEGASKDLVLRGKIDRIDIDPEGKFALVIDYKTGKAFSSETLQKGTALQLPIYLIAVSKKLGLKPLGAHLYSLRDASSSGFHHEPNLARAGVRTQKGNKLSEEEFEEVLARSVRSAERASEAIESGAIPVRPRECVPYCPYSAVCRIEKWRLEHLYRELEEEDRRRENERVTLD